MERRPHLISTPRFEIKTNEHAHLCTPPNVRSFPQVEADRNELHARVTSLRNMVATLEDQLKQTTAQLSMAKDSALELEAEVNKVQLTADQAHRTAEDMERRLGRRAGELQASQEKCDQLERRIGNNNDLF